MANAVEDSDEPFVEENDTQKRAHPWRQRCVTGAELQREREVDDAEDRLTLQAMMCAPDDFDTARILLDRALRKSPDYIPALLTLHMLYNFRPDLFADLAPSPVFAHSSWVRRVRALPRSAQDVARTFFERSMATTAPAVPAALLNLYGFWFDVVLTDMSTATRLWEAAAELEFPPSMNSLAVCSANGEGVRKDHDRAMRLFVAASKQGHANTQRNLGWSYNEIGQTHRALRLFEIAASKGHAPAIVDLATYHRDGLGGLEPDEEEYLRLLRLAVAQGEPWSQCELGLCHEEGRGTVPLDATAAAELYALAAAQELAEGEVRLARCYSAGTGVPRSNDMAVELLKSAVRHGNINAAFTLGLWFWSHARHDEARAAMSICVNNGSSTQFAHILEGVDINDIVQVFNEAANAADAAEAEAEAESE